MSEEMTRIQIALPLPMDVAATVMSLIGTAYPDALMEGKGHNMTFLIPDGSRPRKVSKAKSKPQEATEPSTALLECGPDGISISTPEKLAAACLEIMKASFEQFPDAENYLEQRLWDRESGKGYVMHFQRLEGKSPAELREAAERKLAVAEARIAELEAAA
ncbi:hypothetical protein [Pseudarthrobacter sp. PS3-L1]|uniref:hypothetical protein n=1 Tax=Pseudarthrobacter sp. PS3-L1 TaxID=3046207 RepID=UPI0024B8AA4D|nr:hypothetical protein [Pseudarthrobacter sp. PS3-L1]MDJ0319778.1 hypothetical protein [Pseudarthrobacter sp. PS3-L1]